MDSPQKSSRFPTTKIAALTRMKSLADTITSRRHNSKIIFPPPSWEIDKLAIDSKNGWDQTEFEPPSKTPSGEEAITKLAGSVVSTEVPAALEPDRPEPLTFAQKIRELLESLPFSGTSTTPRQPADTPAAQVLKAEDGSVGPPVPPGVDQDLVQMLSSEEIMNGDEEEFGKEKAERQSVWSILSKMRRKGKEKDVDGVQQSSASAGHAEDGLMVYTPLEPLDDPKVELAESVSIADASSAPSSPVPVQSSEDVEWMPSTTQMSVYTTWWGYRLYLPPAAMASLDSVSLKAAAQAAMITSALKGLLNKVPKMLVPAQFRPALAMMQRLGPVVGFIGVFIAWSWSRIKGHDKGNGVVLTATWVLPVALIPMAWDAGDIYGPVLLPKPEDRIHRRPRRKNLGARRVISNRKRRKRKVSGTYSTAYE